MHGTNVATLPNGILQPEFSLKVWHPSVALLPRTFVGLCDICAMCNVLCAWFACVTFLAVQTNTMPQSTLSPLHLFIALLWLLFVQNTMPVLWSVNCNLVQELECEVSRPSASRAQGLEVRIGESERKIQPRRSSLGNWNGNWTRAVVSWKPKAPKSVKASTGGFQGH